MKLIEISVVICRTASRAPARGAWIEIGMKSEMAKVSAGRAPARGAWIEILPC